MIRQGRANGAIIAGLMLCLMSCVTFAQTDPEATKSRNVKENVARAEPEVPLNEYRDILEKERKLMEDQSERYYARIDKLIDRATSLFSVVAGIFGVIGIAIYSLVKWTLGEARKDVKTSIQGALESSGIAAVKRKYLELEEEIEDINAFKQSRVVWLDWEGNVEPAREINLLRAAGVQNVERRILGARGPTSLARADIIVLSYPPDETSRQLFKEQSMVEKTVNAVKRMTAPVPLIVYAPRGIRLDSMELEKLDELDWQMTANYPVTLLGHAQTLARLCRS